MNKRDYESLTSDIMRDMGRKGGLATKAKLGEEGYRKLGNKVLKRLGPDHYKKMAKKRWAVDNTSEDSKKSNKNVGK